MSVPFRERNPVTIGAISLAVIALMILAAFKADKLPLIGGGDTYYAAFTEAGGLKPNDEVRVAGVRVGKVKAVDLDGDHVKVEFLIEKGTDFGKDTGAQIKVKTLLGQMFLALEPKGSGQLEEAATIPTSRTRSPYDVVKAFSGLASRTDRIDINRLRKSFNTLAAATKNTPEEFQGTLKGLSALSANVAKRDAQLNTLLGNARRCPESWPTGQRHHQADGRQRRPVQGAGRPPISRCTGCSRRPAAVGPALRPRRRLARGPQAALTNLSRWSTCEPEPDQHRPQHPVDGAVLPGLRQHARHRTVVRHLDPDLPPVGTPTVGGN